MKIKILGAGCTTCGGVCDVFKDVAKELNVDAIIEKITDPQEVAEYGITSLPAILINDKVKSTGKVPKREDIIKYIEEEI